jgi:hypothetical protein
MWNILPPGSQAMEAGDPMELSKGIRPTGAVMRATYRVRGRLRLFFAPAKGTPM